MAGTMDFDLLSARVQGLGAASRMDEALHLAEGQREQLAADPRFWVLYGLVLLANDRAADAEAAGQQALALEPGSLSAVNLLTACAHHVGDGARAMELAHVMVHGAPNEALGHFWVATLLASKPSTRTELEEAASAIERALEIDPEDPDNYRLAALIADLSGKTPAALGYLSAGLAIAPNNSALLLASGEIDGARSVVGDHHAVLRGLLAVNPMNSLARDELSVSFLKKLAPLGRLPWLHGMSAALLVQRLGGLWGILAVVLLTAMFAGYGWKKYKAAASGLPDGYDRQVLAETPGASAGLKLLAASALSVLLGAGWGILAADQRPGLLVLGAGVAAGFVGASMLDKAGCAPPGPAATPETINNYLLRRSGAVLAAHGARFWMGALGVLILVLSFPDSSYAPGMIMLIWAGWLLGVGAQLATWALRLGPGGNPWTRGRTLKAAQRHRGVAGAVGNLQGAFYLGSHFLVPTLILIVGASIFNSGTQHLDAPRSPVQHPDRKPLKQLPAPIPKTDFTVPAIPTMPSIDIPDFSTRAPRD